jgi:DNA topoisomerase-3
MATAAVERLWITEKPDMARNLAAGLKLALNARVTNEGTARSDGFIRFDNGDVVTNLLGHMIEPEFLSAEHKKARIGTYFSFLPIVVKDFNYAPKPDRNKDGTPRMRDGKPVPSAQYGVVKKLIGQARQIVNSGDVDREGQLIVDELLIHCGVDPEGRSKPIWRLPLVSTKEEDIRAQVLSLSERNGDPKWVRRRCAALARQHCDAALGFNASMTWQEVSGYARMSVGRVQTPVLALVDDRERQIEGFRPTNYFVPVITLADGTTMRWHKREGAEGSPGFDAEGRITDEAVAKAMVQRIAAGLAGTITINDATRHSVAPPLPFSASILASTVAKRYGLTPKEAEKAAQSLYEKHKAISYVGTDCQYLPSSLKDEARQTLAALSKIFPAQAAGASLSIQSKAWNDEKVDEHYAIIPTGRLPVNPDAAEKAVFETVAKRYTAQFYSNFEYLKRSMSALFGGDEFRASSREVLRQGWKEVEGDAEMSDRDAQAMDDAEHQSQGASATNSMDRSGGVDRESGR